MIAPSAPAMRTWGTLNRVMTQQRFWVVWLVGVAAIAAEGRICRAGEPEITATVLRDWSFTAAEAGAGEHPVAEAPDGSIIVGHTRGLFRFDGHRMIPLEMSLGSSPVKLLLTDRSGNLHVVLTDGTHAIRGKHGLQVVEDAAVRPPLTDGTTPEPLSLCEAGDGSVWVGYRQGVVSRTVGFRRTWHGIPAGDSESPDTSAYVTSDTTGRVWLARRTRLAVWSGNDWRVAQHLPDQQTFVAPARDGGVWIRLGSRVQHFDGTRLTQPFAADILTIRGLVEDNAGRLWIATTRYGLVMWDGSRLATAETASSSMYSLVVDRRGVIWAGTTAGLEWGRPRLVQRVEMPTIKGLQSIRCDAADRLWFLTLDGEVGSQSGPLTPWLRSGGRSTDTTVFHTRLDGWRYGSVTAVTIAADDTVWLGTRDGGIVRIDQEESNRSENLSTPPELRGQPVTSLLSIGDGLLVAIGTSLLWNQDDRWHPVAWPAGHPAAEVTFMVAESDSTAWFATATGGLFRLAINSGEDEPSAVVLELIPPPAGNTAAITSIVPLPNGPVWIATRGAGLWRWQGGEWSQVASIQGLPTETVLAAVPDAAGRLWCVAPRLFFAVMLDELAATADRRIDRCHCWIVTRDDRTAFFDPAIVPPDIATIDRDGTILVVLPTGIAACFPDRLPLGSPPPPVSVSDVRIDGQPLRPLTTMARVSPDPRLVEIFLGESLLPVPTNARVEHQLVGIDPDWIETPADRRLVYERLPPGRHPLRLRSTNEAGTWTDSAPACTLDIAPAWWERPAVRWGAMLAVALTTAAATLSFQSRKTAARMERLRQQATLDRERMRIARDMHDDLGTSLTQISLLADLAGRKAAPEAAASLAHISRIACDTVAAFDEIVWAVNPEHDTLQHLLGYLALSASETLASLGIECRLDIPSHVPPRIAPAEFRRGVLLIVKEAVTNIVRHAEARQVAICWRVAGERLTITITDDGQGTSSAGSARPRPALGLDNMHRRAEELGGGCTVTVGPTGGTQVTLDLPLPRDDHAGTGYHHREEAPDAI